MRIHKRIEEEPAPVTTGSRLFKLLNDVKSSVDDRISTNENLLGNAAFFEREVQRFILQASKEPKEVNCNGECIKNLATLVTNEYLANLRRSA